ncbi:MAG: ABC transporter ATP-binding protein [Gemmatimonadales bacterium]
MLYGVDFEIASGEVVALIGANGAGKSTFLKTICGVLGARRDAVTLDGQPIGGLAPGEIVRRGIAMVPEGRRLFSSLSAEENLMMGACARRDGPWTLDAIYRLFPLLAEKRRAPAATLSGGQQQMVAIGRALMSNPKLLLCDELSLGLAPVVVDSVYEGLSAIHDEGCALLLVEQQVDRALALADHAVLLARGAVHWQGPPAEAGAQMEQLLAAGYGTAR